MVARCALLWIRPSVNQGVGRQTNILTEMIVALGAPVLLGSIVDLFPKIVMKNIANLHRKHDVQAFSKHRPKHRRAMFLSKHRLNIASLRIGKHRIVKKNENCPALHQQMESHQSSPLNDSQLVTRVANNQTRVH